MGYEDVFRGALMPFSNISRFSNNIWKKVDNIKGGRFIYCGRSKVIYHIDMLVR